MPVPVSRRVVFSACLAGLSQIASGRQFGFETRFVFLNRQRCDRCTDGARDSSDRPFCRPVVAIGKPSQHTSEPPVTAPATSIISGPRATTLYEFEPNALDNGECRIRDISIQIDSFGNWHAYLTAQHAPDGSADARRRVAPPRFEFRVDLIADVADSVTQSVDQSWVDSRGPQLVARQEFWVKAAESRRVSLSGQSGELQAAHDTLSGFRAEFSWRRG